MITLSGGMLANHDGSVSEQSEVSDKPNIKFISNSRHFYACVVKMYDYLNINISRSTNLHLNELISPLNYKHEFNSSLCEKSTC